MLDRRFLAVLIIGGALLALLTWAGRGYHERDALRAWADIQCAAAGSAYAPTKTRPGEACGQAIAGLAAFKAQTDQESAQILADAMADAATRNTKAAEQARQAAAAARVAAQHMEAVDAAVEDDRVGSDWFDALNRAGGLRDQSAR